MNCKDRQGNIVNSNQEQEKIIKKLYETKMGRVAVKVLIKPEISKAGGWVLNRNISKVAIKPFVKNSGINLDDYKQQEYSSYNDFFMRKIKEEKRPINNTEENFISPCDSKLSIYKISDDSKFMIKNTEYTLKSLTRSEKISDYFQGGTLMLFRLTVDDYHRYCYVDEGVKTKNFWINGVFHTVNPIANDQCPIYKENTRCFSLLKSKNFGSILMMEVGALMVGRIVNYHEKASVLRGEEKGRFEFGGSTVILVVKDNIVDFDKDIVENSLAGIETKVKYGEKIGVKICK